MHHAYGPGLVSRCALQHRRRRQVVVRAPSAACSGRTTTRPAGRPRRAGACSQQRCSRRARNARPTTFATARLRDARPSGCGIAAENRTTGARRVNDSTKDAALASGRCSATSSDNATSKVRPTRNGRVRSIGGELFCGNLQQRAIDVRAVEAGQIANAELRRRFQPCADAASDVDDRARRDELQQMRQHAPGRVQRAFLLPA